MNIFHLSTNPAKSAQYHPDPLVVKMPLELSQQLASGLAANGIHEVMPKKDGGFYKPAYVSHICTKWTGECYENFMYVCDLLLELVDEYERRYNKPSTYREPLMAAIDNAHHIPSNGTGKVERYPLAFGTTGKTRDYKFFITCCWRDGIIDGKTAQSLNQYHYADQDLAVKLYRAYMLYGKTHYACWSYSEVPSWWHTQEDCGKMFCKLTAKYWRSVM